MGPPADTWSAAAASHVTIQPLLATAELVVATEAQLEFYQQGTLRFPSSSMSPAPSPTKGPKKSAQHRRAPASKEEAKDELPPFCVPLGLLAAGEQSTATTIVTPSQHRLLYLQQDQVPPPSPLPPHGADSLPSHWGLTFLNPKHEFIAYCIRRAKVSGLALLPTAMH